jgi:DNA replication initiation complex subunit (GINS family)
MKSVTMKLLGLRNIVEQRKNTNRISETELRFYTDLLDIVDDLTMEVDRLSKEVFNDSFINPANGGPSKV